MQFLYTVECLALGLLALWIGLVAAAQGAWVGPLFGFVGAAMLTASIVARARHNV